MESVPEDSIPEDLRYSEKHEWIAVDGDVGTVGITDYAQSELGDIVFVELPEAGDVLEQGQAFGTVEAVKTVEDIYSPVSGEVVEANDSLEEAAEQVNADPYGAGWMVRIRLSRSEEVDALLSASDYGSFIDQA